MLKHNWLWILGLFLCLQFAAAGGAKAAEDFYWKDTYGRGVGTIPPEVCGTKENDAGLCYDKCKSGYHGIGPVCWDNQQGSYGRGVGTIPKLSGACPNGKEKDAGLCYDNCKQGYTGHGPVCWNNQAASYGRGAGTIPAFDCKGGMQKDAGLCYTPCKAGYSGVGPVCWQNAPAGYVECGAGFAASKDECASIVAAQVFAVAQLIGNVAPEAKAAWEAAKAKDAAEDVETAGKILKELEPFFNKVKEILEPLKAKAKGFEDTVDDIKKAWNDFMTPERKATLDKLKTAYKGVKAGAKVTASLTSGQTLVADYIRDIANIVAVVDPTGVAATIGAYSYPVYGATI